MDGFQVYVIHSSKPLTQLKETLDECGGHNYAGIIYKSMKARGQQSGGGNGKEETKKTIVFCPPQTVRQLEMAYPDFAGKIADYNWESFPLPDESLGETWNLHISGVPNDYTDVEAQEFITQSLKVILPQSVDQTAASSEGTAKGTAEGTAKGPVVNYKVEFPPRLRETGEINGYGKVIFGDHVDHEMIKLCKIVLNNTPRAFKNNPKERRMISCTWHRNHKAVSRFVSAPGFANGPAFASNAAFVPGTAAASGWVDKTAPVETADHPTAKYVVKPRVASKTIRKARPAIIHVVEDDPQESAKVTQVDMSKLDMDTTKESVTSIKK